MSFIKQLSGEFAITEFYWKVQKQGFSRIFIFLLEFQLIKINIAVIIFKLIIFDKHIHFFKERLVQ